MSDEDLISIDHVACCPEITKEPCCEKLQFAYRLEHRSDNRPVEVVIVAELERCPGPLALGDVVYSTTLLPGERVRLYTAHRNNRYSYDSESNTSYRQVEASEETYYMSSMDHFMSELTVTDQGSSSSASSSAFEVSTSADGVALPFFAHGSVRVSGQHNAFSSAAFARELSRHAESSHERSVQSTRAANSISIGEVESRTHVEGESESAYEASTRIIENRNQCHAVTYFAYQLVKRQTIKFRIKAVLRQVVDPSGSAVIDSKPPKPPTGISVIRQGVLATQLNRVEVENVGRNSASLTFAPIGGAGGLAGTGTATIQRFQREAPPLTQDERDAALKVVDQELVKAGMLDAKGAVTDKFRAEVEFERTTCLPTRAVVVKGCIDRCNVCEESLQRSIELDLRRKELENRLLEEQINNLPQSQEYRCCPAGEVET